MEPEGTAQSESEPETFLEACAVLLGLRRFTSCRDFARRVPRSDPEVSKSVDQILAIADVLLAAERRLNNNHFDWYAILQIHRYDSKNRQLTRKQFKKLVLLLNPNKNKFPFSVEALMRVREAWFVLSDPERRAQYEHEIDNRQPEKPCKQSGGIRGRNVGGGDPKATFWTVCPYCWNLYQYQKEYEGCSLRCQNCKKAFHGVAVSPPAPEMVVEGEDQYYCYYACLASHDAPLEKRRKTNSQQEWGMEDRNKNVKCFVYVSDDGDDDIDHSAKKCGIGEQERGFQAEGTGAEVNAGTQGVHKDLGKNVGDGIQGNVRNEECERVIRGIGRTELQSDGKRRWKIKTVPRGRKKFIGNRMRRQEDISSDRETQMSDLVDEDAELEFAEGDGDIYVGLRCAK